MLLLVALLLGGAPAARAADAVPADSLRHTLLAAIAADSSGIDSTLATLVDTTAAAVAPVSPPPARQGAEGDTLAGGRSRDAPYRVMLRSLLVPGWGQVYNGKWWKAGIAAGGQGALVASYIVQDHLARTATDPTARARAIDARQAALWFYAGAALVSMLDAYVDAHLFTFGKEFTPVEVRLTPAASPLATQVACALSVGF